MKKVSGFIIILQFLLVLGWGRCVYKFATCDFNNAGSWKAEILYGIGTFTGAGAVIGWLEFGN